MKIPMRLAKLQKSILAFIHLQLFITLISLPILLCWGMPISLLTFAGNFLFAPILTAFLLFSSLIFFCQLLFIPSYYLIVCLEQITHWWLWIMNFADHKCLIALRAPSLAILICIPFFALLILHSKKINTPIKGICAYGILLALICIYIKLQARPLYTINRLDCNKGQITLIQTPNQLTLIDPGVIGRRLSAPSWCEYTLMPHLVKEYGTHSITHCIILQPNKIIFDAVLFLLDKIEIKNIYIPLWEGKLPYYWWISYLKLREQCKKKNCKLIRIAQKNITLCLDKITQLTINPLEQRITTTQDFSYPSIRIDTKIDKQESQIYSAKHILVSSKKKRNSNGTS